MGYHSSLAPDWSYLLSHQQQQELQEQPQQQQQSYIPPVQRIPAPRPSPRPPQGSALMPQSNRGGRDRDDDQNAQNCSGCNCLHCTRTRAARRRRFGFRRDGDPRRNADRRPDPPPSPPVPTGNPHAGPRVNRYRHESPDPPQSADTAAEGNVTPVVSYPYPGRSEAECICAICFCTVSMSISNDGHVVIMECTEAGVPPPYFPANSPVSYCPVLFPVPVQCWARCDDGSGKSELVCPCRCGAAKVHCQIPQQGNDGDWMVYLRVWCSVVTVPAPQPQRG